MKIFLFILVLTISCVVSTTQVFAQTLFSGLVVSERKEGLRVVDTQPGSPSFYAGLKAGDMVLEIDGRETKTIDDYLKISREVKNKKVEVFLTVRRAGVLYEAILKIYSIPINQQWEIKVTKPIELPEGVTNSAFKYWIGKGKSTLNKSSKTVPFEQKVGIYDEAVKYFFNALHYQAESIDTALLIAGLYHEFGSLYLDNGNTNEGIIYYKNAIKLNTNCLKKTQEEGYLQLILTNLQEIEKKLSKIEMVKPQIANNKQHTIIPDPGGEL